MNGDGAAFRNHQAAVSCHALDRDDQVVVVRNLMADAGSLAASKAMMNGWPGFDGGDVMVGEG